MATTIRFGTTSSACNTADAERAHFVEETEKGNSDPEKLLQCPFDKNHLIRTCRFPYHLIKCRKNHPKLASELKTCPFNARHLVHKHELAHHTETCEDRITVCAEDEESTNADWKWKVPVSTWVNPDMSEDWGTEVDDAATPFVWGVNTALDQKLSDNLGSCFRSPDALPWSADG
ncbi:gametocyte-specific factor 1 isoform X2 [Pseudoliparis swirei]|uniref:gametocyte-specific factor 1 isoform X2 n=1 Tax=Pseudoliparis swirei TaxID=2059687 RepID=UPI0024BD626A|nr:gametocyte-specific factor 1 isoform X2 [Pseudoliparis swirei]